MILRAPLLITLGLIITLGLGLSRTASADSQVRTKDWYQQRLSENRAAKTILASVIKACGARKGKKHSACIDDHTDKFDYALGESAKLNMDIWAEGMGILLCNNGHGTAFDLNCVKKGAAKTMKLLDVQARQFLDQIKNLELRNSVATVGTPTSPNPPAEAALAERKAFSARRGKSLSEANAVAEAENEPMIAAPLGSQSDSAPPTAGKSRRATAGSAQ